MATAMLTELKMLADLPLNRRTKPCFFKTKTTYLQLNSY
jgi:hypothetical protein